VTPAPARHYLDFGSQGGGHGRHGAQLGVDLRREQAPNAGVILPDLPGELGLRPAGLVAQCIEGAHHGVHLRQLAARALILGTEFGILHLGGNPTSVVCRHLLDLLTALHKCYRGSVAPMIAEDKMAAEDRSVFAGDARLELVAKLPSNAKLVEIDAGHTIHRDRFDDYMAAILDWLDTGTTGQEGEGAR
jgi:hypothetical protein